MNLLVGSFRILFLIIVFALLFINTSLAAYWEGECTRDFSSGWFGGIGVRINGFELSKKLNYISGSTIIDVNAEEETAKITSFKYTLEDAFFSYSDDYTVGFGQTKNFTTTIHLDSVYLPTHDSPIELIPTTNGNYELPTELSFDPYEFYIFGGYTIQGPNETVSNVRLLAISCG